MPNLDHEYLAGYPSRIVAGADEVGRGCLAGPVVAGAVILPSKVDYKRDPWLKDIDDSKKLSPKAREELAPLILNWVQYSAIGLASSLEIDRINIFHATHLAITRAVSALKVQPHHVLIDGKFLPRDKDFVPATAIIQGDQKSLSIAAASILAKVWRDRLMSELDEKYPGYGFVKHKGYPTPQHTLALKKIGVCEIHRRSFGTVAELM